MENRRIVLSTKDNLLYTGIVSKTESILQEKGIFIELDSRSGLKLWCPEKNIASVIEVDLSKYQEAEKDD